MMTPPSYTETGQDSSKLVPVSVTSSTQDNLWGEGSPCCAGCGSVIYDEMIQKVNGKLWHTDCLRCACCRQSLRQFCFSDGKELYCEEDFMSYFGWKCAGCCMQMSPTEIVRKVHHNIYHMTCFVCEYCQRDLQTGDKIYLRDDNKLICEDDYHRMKEQNQPRVCGIDSDSDSTGSGKRLRTNISIQQANILSQAYQQNNKPSRHALRQLGQETGLDARVVRVWFQNKRAKAKKTFPLNNYPLGQGHEVIENIDDDDSNGSFTGNESCRYNRTNQERRNNQSGQLSFQDQNKTPSCGRISQWIQFLDTLSPDCIPPNIELTADDIKNGEVCMKARNGFTSPVNNGITPPVDSRFISPVENRVTAPVDSNRSTEKYPHFQNTRTESYSPGNCNWIPGL